MKPKWDLPAKEKKHGKRMGTGKYIDPTTDYGFKRIFGTETNKNLLISLLNELFRGRKVIKDLEYNRNDNES